MIDKDLHPALLERPAPLSGTFVEGMRFFDNSSLDTYRVCPRKFYFRHIRNWETSALRMPLIFGSSIHAAQDFIWLNMTQFSDSSLLEGSMNSFIDIWDTFGIDPIMGFDYYPRTPERAKEILRQYIIRYRDLISRYNIIGIEQPFVVPLLEESSVMYIGKLDKIFEYQGHTYIVDHKTASSFAGNWMEQFSPNGQIDGYLHCGHTTYPNFSEVIIDGILVAKKDINFQRIPVKRQISQLNSWMWEVQELIDQIEVNEERLHHYRSSKPLAFMPAFPKCTSSCTTYYGLCPYSALCKSFANPELEDCPDGFVESKWAPFHISLGEGGSLDIAITGGE